MNIDLALPKAKKFCPGHVQVNPFPVAEIFDEQQQCVGHFTGMSVEVFDPNDIRRLYENGFYGAGSHTKVQPRISTPNASLNPRYVSRSMYDAKNGLRERFGNHNPNEVSLKIRLDDNGMGDTDESSFVIEADPFPLEESLVLSLEEALFLQQSLRCLRILDLVENAELSADDFLSICCALKKNFVLHYLVYYYYRSKSWIVKSGLKYGGDFLLYYKGPKYYHASYVVIVNDSRNNVNVMDMQSNYRVAETANKEVIISNVISPEGLSYDEPRHCIERLAEFQINEFLPKRFQPQLGASEQPSTSTSWKKIKTTDASNKL